MDTKGIGEKIRQFRRFKGLTQEELAKEAGLSTMSIRRYESGDRIAPQEALLKIAKVLGVHLRDLSDDSWLEEIDRQLGPEKLGGLQTETTDSPMVIHLKSLGFTVSEQVTKWHWEDENEVDPEERVQIPDESIIVLSKDGHTATFTDAEFQELQAGAKEAIEARFYKKVLEQQKK